MFTRRPHVRFQFRHPFIVSLSIWNLSVANHLSCLVFLSTDADVCIFYGLLFSSKLTKVFLVGLLAWGLPHGSFGRAPPVWRRRVDSQWFVPELWSWRLEGRFQTSSFWIMREDVLPLKDPVSLARCLLMWTIISELFPLTTCMPQRFNARRITIPSFFERILYKP